MTTAARPVRPPSRSRIVLSNPSYRRLWAMGAASTTMRWLETVAVGAFVLDLTGSPFAVALTFFFRMIPMFALGAVIGGFSDRINRKRLLMLSSGTMATVYVLLGVAVLTDVIAVWHIYLGALVAGIVWSTDFPVRRAMIGDVVERENVGAALGLDMATSNFTKIPGPFLGGVFLDTIGMEAVYFLGAVLFLFAGVVAFTLSYTPPEKRKELVSPLRNIVEGVRYIRRDTVIITVLFITIVMNMFAFPYQSMVPVIAEESLKVSNTMFGLLVSVEGMGATLGALWVASRATPGQYSRVYFWGSILFLCTVFSFSRVPWYGLAMPLLFIGGFGMAGFGTMQSIIMISATPVEMRGRVLGVLAVSIGTGPIAALYVGAIAEAAGAPAAVMIISIAGLVLMTATALVNPGFLRLREVQPLAEREAGTVRQGSGAVTAVVDGSVTSRPGTRKT